MQIAIRNCMVIVAVFMCICVRLQYNGISADNPKQICQRLGKVEVIERRQRVTWAYGKTFI